LGKRALLACLILQLATGANALPSEVSIANTRRIDFTSQVNGHRYSISVAFPYGEAPPKGYGILYVLDGYAYFASATEVVRPWNAPDVVVVGIGYPTDSAYLKKVVANRGPAPAAFKSLPLSVVAQQLEREYDLTLPASDQELSQQQSPGSPPLKHQNVGGLDDFLKIIETEVKPRVSAMTRIDPARQALFGHSLGGLATLHALFTEPDAFGTFIIASPSIWWNNKAVLAGESTFATEVISGRASPKVLVTMGSEESSPPAIVPASWGISREDLAAALAKARMVENARELVVQLKALQGGKGYEVADYAVFEQQSHALSPFTALARGVAFAFSGRP
jgi:predicted alpha/beta superfamily hydrolase